MLGRMGPAKAEGPKREAESRRMANAEWGMGNSEAIPCRLCGRTADVSDAFHDRSSGVSFPIPHSPFPIFVVKTHSSRLKRSVVLAIKLAVLALVAWGIHHTA